MGTASANFHHDLEQVGFAVVSLLDADEVARLLADFEACHPDAGSGFETDFERDDAAFKVGVAERTGWVWDRLEALLPGYAPFMASYLVKWPTPDSHLGLHADWSYVDEEVHPSYAVWVPLVDTGPGIDNGPLAVVPGSHRLVRSWRGTATPAWYESGHDGFLEAAVLVEAPAGCAVVFDNRLLHHSPPNHGPVPRPVLAGAFAPVGASLVHVFGDGGTTGRVVPVDATFFCEHNPSGLRAAPPEVPDDAPVVDLVSGAYDPVGFAADHGLDDVSSLGSDSGRRWSNAGPLAVSDPQAVLDRGLDLASLTWAPERIDAPSAAIQVPFVVAGRATPTGTAVLGLTDADTTWSSLRLVRLGPGSELDLDLGTAAGEWQLSVVGLAPDDPSVLVVGPEGWDVLGVGAATALPSPAVVVRNRADHDVALVVADPLPASAAPGRLHRWLDRRRKAPAAWQLAVELSEAVS